MLFACEAGDELQPQYIRGAQAVRIALSVHLVGSSAPSAEEVQSRLSTRAALGDQVHPGALRANFGLRATQKPRSRALRFLLASAVN